MTYAIQADSAALQHHINTATKPVLVDFTASWCGPCKGMAPHLEAFAQERADSLHVLKVDIDENQEQAMRFMVRSVPTLILMKDGNVLAAKAGAMGRQQLAQFVDAQLPSE
jgi:thioredoxin 1